MSHASSLHQPSSTGLPILGNPYPYRIRLLLPFENWKQLTSTHPLQTRLGLRSQQLELWFHRFSMLSVHARMVAITQVPVIIVEFQRMGFSKCPGATDGTHIPILYPVKGATDYINQKGYHSFIHQGLGGSQGSVHEHQN